MENHKDSLSNENNAPVGAAARDANSGMARGDVNSGAAREDVNSGAVRGTVAGARGFHSSDGGGYKSPVRHSMTRRARFHDYCRPSVYMFTLYRHPAAPALSTVIGTPLKPDVVLSAVGRIFKEEILKTESMRRDSIEIPSYVIMPDHAHVMVRVLTQLSMPVTMIVAKIESACTSRCRREGLISPEMSIFKGDGMTDSIVCDDRRYFILVNYIRDNPRRLLIKRLHTDLFRRNLSVRIGLDVIDCVGNMFLLRRPMKQVHVRRAWDQERVRAYREECLAEAAEGVVLVSPFIHPVENEIRKTVLESGGSVIHIMDHGFGERFKPTGRGMDTCVEGRMLLVCEAGAPTVGEDMSYAKASRLNRLAERLAAIGPEQDLRVLPVR